MKKREARAKRNKPIKKYIISLSSGDRGVTDAEGLQQTMDEAASNFAGVSGGTWDEATPIVIRHLDTRVTEVPVPPLPKPAPIELEAGSTFPSAKYKAQDMNSGVFNRTLDEAATYLSDLQDDFGDDVAIKIKVIAGESQVTPPKGMKTGDLARLRAKTAQEQAIKYFASQDIDIQHIDVQPVTVVGSTPYQSRRDDPHADCYTQEQFLRIQIEMVGEPRPLPPLRVETLLSEPIYLDVDSERKSKTFRWPDIDLNLHFRRRPRRKKRRRRSKRKPFKNKLSCPVW